VCTCLLSTDIILEDGHQYDEDACYDDDEQDDTGTTESHDRLLDLLAQNREYLKKGDYRLLYAIRKEYGDRAQRHEVTSVRWSDVLGHFPDYLSPCDTSKMFFYRVC